MVNLVVRKLLLLSGIEQSAILQHSVTFTLFLSELPLSFDVNCVGMYMILV